MNVRIRGDGIAARCCAHLLSRAGTRVSIEAANRPRVAAIMLGRAAQQLIRETFERDELFRDLPEIRKRVVAWGPHAAPVELDHSAVVVSEEYLLNSLGSFPAEAFDADWTICSAAPLPAATEEHRFGSRIASAQAVKLKPGAPEHTCWVESVQDGWLFMTPEWLLTAGEHALERSALVREQIDGLAPASASFPASPRIVTPLGGPGWMACGSATIGFDPICGDGTAHAVREAILAAAVIRSIARGEKPEPPLAHYQARLVKAFERHLLHCREFYFQSGWESEVDATARGIRWCEARLAESGPFRYRLVDEDLVPL